jgi:hypothetical protein
MISTSSERGGVWQRLYRGVRRIFARADWHDYAGPDWADHIMDVQLTDDFHAKQGRSTGRWVLRAGGKPLAVYLKRHDRLPWWRGLLATFWPGRSWSPALHEARNLHWAHAHGFPVPDVAATGEFIGPWGRLRSFLAVEELTGMLPLHEAIPAAQRRLDARAFHAWKRSLTAELARLAAALHRLRHFHKDLYLCHFFVPEADTRRLPANWRGRVHMIDLHRLAHHPWTWRTWQLKDLSQLLYSSHMEGVTARDRLRFWRAYLGPERRRLLNRFFAWCIRLKSRRYLDHNAKKRARQQAARRERAA